MSTVIWIVRKESMDLGTVSAVIGINVGFAIAIFLYGWWSIKKDERDTTKIIAKRNQEDREEWKKSLSL